MGWGGHRIRSCEQIVELGVGTAELLSAFFFPPRRVFLFVLKPVKNVPAP